VAEFSGVLARRACADTRAVHLELTGRHDVPMFLLAIRRFVARRGLPASFISDNTKTFKSASKNLKKVIRSQEFSRYTPQIGYVGNSLWTKLPGGADSRKD
jgi:hypothetical protein